MKTKHNKKRNTAFVYEALLREVTKSIVSRDTERKNKAISILKEYFKQGTNLSKELGCYKALIKEDALDQITQKIALNRIGQPQDIANVVLFFPRHIFSPSFPSIHPTSPPNRMNLLLQPQQ